MPVSIAPSIYEMLEHTLIIIPCYNEANRLPINAFRRFFEQFPQCQFCFVNDGSDDETLPLLQGLVKEHPQLKLLHLQDNHGKAEAVRQGMLECASTSPLQYMGYWDADLATPLEELTRFLEIFQTQPDLLMVAGSRVQLLGRTIERHWYRHYIGRVFATFASLLLQLPIYDTQCGAKLMQAQLAKTIFQKPFLTPWLFDIEMIARMNLVWGHKEVRKKIYELPLNIWVDVAGTKIKWSDMLRVPFQLLKIAYFYYKKPIE